MKILLLLALAIVWVQARVGQRCTETEQCGDEECCEIRSEFMVVSKRQVDAVRPIDILRPTREGTCNRYKTVNETCGVFDQANGLCSCGPGLRCNSFQVKINPDARRSMIAPEPGYMWLTQCTPTN